MHLEDSQEKVDESWYRDPYRGVPSRTGLTAFEVTKDNFIYGPSTGMFMTRVDLEKGVFQRRLFIGGEMLENVPAIYGDKVFDYRENGWLNAIK